MIHLEQAYLILGKQLWFTNIRVPMSNFLDNAIRHTLSYRSCRKNIDRVTIFI